MALPWRCITAAAQQWKPLHVSHKIKEMVENLEPPLSDTVSSVRGLYRAAVKQTATAQPSSTSTATEWYESKHLISLWDQYRMFELNWIFLSKTIKLANMLKILRLGLTVPNNSAWKGNLASKSRYWLLMSKQQNPASKHLNNRLKRGASFCLRVSVAAPKISVVSERGEKTGRRTAASRRRRSAGPAEITHQKNKQEMKEGTWGSQSRLVYRS